jgi:hypothetical protein
MTLFFDIQKLEKQANGNDLKFIEILQNHYEITVLKKTSFKKFKSIKGSSYLLNPQAIFNSLTRSIDIAYIVQYVRLAARRSYPSYTLYNITWLDITFFPEIDLNSIKNNPLLKITTNYIYFKFEEIYNGTKLRKN